MYLFPYCGLRVYYELEVANGLICPMTLVMCNLCTVCGVWVLLGSLGLVDMPICAVI